MTRSESAQSSRIAVVRLDALGDTLLSTPAIDVLQREVGRENVLVLTSPGLGHIFGDVIPHREVPPEADDQAIGQMIDEFEADRVFVFSEKKRALRGAFSSQAGQRIGFDPGWTQPLRSLEVKRYLTVRFSIVNSLDSHSRYHEVDRYCRLVGKGLSRKFVNGGKLKFFGLSEQPRSPENRIGLQLARKWLREGWPEGLLVRLTESLPRDTLLFVSPDEKEWAQSLLPGRDFVCQADLRDYARALARCRYLISIDTGAVHVACAMGVPVVDVFPESGSHHTVPRWRPWMTPHQVVLKPAFCEGEMERFLASLEEARQAMEQVLDWQMAGAR